MKKKILIIVPILIVALIVIIAIPKHNNNDIEETPQEVSETPEVSEPEPEITPEPEKEKTLRQEKGINQFNAKQGLVAGHEVQETTEPEATETAESLDDGINSTHTDVELTEDEYQGDEATDGSNINLKEEDQAAVNRIEENLKKKHPEWFADTPSTGTGEGNYEHVGTPDNGELPPSTFGQGDYSGLEGGQVY